MKTAIIILSALMLGCTLDDEREGINTDDILTFDAITGSAVPADSTTAFTVKVVLGEKVSKEQEITFTTDQGWFQGTGSQENKKEIKRTTNLKAASVVLIPDTTPNKNVALTASVKNGSQVYTITKYVDFTTAYPTLMFISSDKETLPADRSSKVVMTIIPAQDPGQGKVSDDIRIGLTATRTEGTVEVSLAPFVKTVHGSASFILKSTNSLAGTIKVTATVADKDHPVTTSKNIVFTLP